MKSRMIPAMLAVTLSIAAPVVGYYEGTRNAAYIDPVGIPTICDGHTGADVKMGRKATAEECARLLQVDLGEAYAAVSQCTRAPLEPYEAAAMTSFAFNVGGNAYCRSTMAKLINAGAPGNVFCQQLKLWTHARRAGILIELPGLVKRRDAEFNMCMGFPWRKAS